MSNPGVILLADIMIDKDVIKIEDNIGECIHLHYGTMRLDMSIKDFIKFSDELTDMMEKMVNVLGFSFRKFDALFLSTAAQQIYELKHIKFDKVFVGDLRTSIKKLDMEPSLISIYKSPVMRALHGDETENNVRIQPHYWGVTSSSRLQQIKNSIQDNGYWPERYGNYIVLIDGGTYIIDGCHRACCILDIYGNIEIPVAIWNTRTGDYTDDNVLKKLLALPSVSEQIQQKKRLLSLLLKHDLSGKKVVLKGAGKHTEELLPILRQCEIEIIGITANQYSSSDIPVIRIENLRSCGADVILISSFLHRKEMKIELLKYSDQFEIYDIYDHGFDGEFFQ